MKHPFEGTTDMKAIKSLRINFLDIVNNNVSLYLNTRRLLV